MKSEIRIELRGYHSVWPSVKDIDRTDDVFFGGYLQSVLCVSDSSRQHTYIAMLSLCHGCTKKSKNSHSDRHDAGSLGT